MGPILWDRVQALLPNADTRPVDDELLLAYCRAAIASSVLRERSS
jgi:hypothetical protein